MIRRSGTQAAQAELDKAEAALAAEREAREEAVLELGCVLVPRRGELAEDKDAYRANEVAIAERQGDIARLELVILRREAEFEEAARRLAHATWSDSRAELERAYAANRKSSAAVAGTLEALDLQLAELEQRRVRVQELEAKFRALVPSDVDEWAFPSEARDEPDWPALGDVLEVAASGPRQPGAQEAQGAERAARQAEQRSRNEIAVAVEEAVTEGRFGRLEQLASGQVDEARQLAEDRIDAELARRMATRESAFQLSGGGDEVLAALERRRERVRALASSEVHAAA